MVTVKDLKPQLGRTGGLAEDLKQQVESLRADYREIAKVLRGVYALEEAAAAGTAAWAGEGFWPQPFGPSR